MIYKIIKFILVSCLEISDAFVLYFTKNSSWLRKIILDNIERLKENTFMVHKIGKFIRRFFKTKV